MGGLPRLLCGFGRRVHRHDLRDAQDDRLHPLKRLRPIPRGELPRKAALALAAFFAALTLVIARRSRFGFAGPAGALPRPALQAGYSLGLKHVVLLDVMMIGALFVVHAAAGRCAVDVRISPWLLLYTRSSRSSSDWRSGERN